MIFSLAIHLPPPPKKKERFLWLPIILSVCQFEISARIRLNSALGVGCLRVFLAALSKVFRKASLSLMKEQVSRLAKSAPSNVFSYFVSEFGFTGERLIPDLRRKDWILRALFLAVTSLWPHKGGSRNEIYSARWKLMLISDQAKDLVKICFEGGGCMSPFQPLVYILDLE